MNLKDAVAGIPVHVKIGGGVAAGILGIIAAVINVVPSALQLYSNSAHPAPTQATSSPLETTGRAKPSLAPISLARNASQAPIDGTTHPSLQPSEHPLGEVLVLENLQDPNATGDEFPLDYLELKLSPLTNDTPTKIEKLRVAVAFVEPPDMRSQSFTGPVGYIEASLPQFENCTRKFGKAQIYPATDIKTTYRLAINDAAPGIAAWIIKAVTKEPAQCPQN